MSVETPQTITKHSINNIYYKDNKEYRKVQRNLHPKHLFSHPPHLS